jgi:hypothetical protein
MKKVLIILTVLMLSFISVLPAQVFKKGKSFIGAGLAFGPYFQTIQMGENTGTNKTSSFVNQIDYEYGILDQVGIGIMYRRNTYFFTDSMPSSSKKSNAFLFSNILHFINKKHLDIFLGMAYGPGFYYYNAQNNTTNTNIVLQGIGLNYCAFGGLRHFISSSFGINFGFSYDNFSYDITNYKVNDINQFKKFRNNYNLNYSGFNIFGGVNFLLTKN